MKKLFLILLFFNFNNVFSQSSDFQFHYTSRYARTIGMGDAFCGIADGIESVYYNPAGLTYLNNANLVFSNRDGNGWFADITPYNFSFAMPIKKLNGTIAISTDILKSEIAYSNSYSIHFARTILNNFSMGLSLSYYKVFFEESKVVIYPEYNSYSIDIGLSALHLFPNIGLINKNDQFGIGIFLNNILNTKMNSNVTSDELKSQFFRTGISYKSPIEILPIPFSILITFDAYAWVKDYEILYWQPNYGFEFTFFKYIFLRYGHQNEIEVKDVYDVSPQFPVDRYGIGIFMPINEMLNLNNQISLGFDYSFSDWTKINESIKLPDYFGIREINQNAYTVKLSLSM